MKKTNVNNVTAGKPKVGGAVYCASLGTALPTDAKAALADDYKCLGYISSDGVTNSNSPDSDKVKAWGGDVVLETSKGKEDTLKFKMIEYLNVEVLKFVYGDDNVKVSDAGAITVVANSSDTEAHVIVVDMVARGGKAVRFIAPSAKITKLEDIQYKDDDAVGYEVEMNCQPCNTYDSVFTEDNNATHVVYID